MSMMLDSKFVVEIRINLNVILKRICAFSAKGQEQIECARSVTLYGHCLTFFKFSLV
jgi:hypothetical protein